MIFIPLPFVVSLLLLTILVQIIRRGDLDLRENYLFVLLIVAYALESVLIGLRWGWDLRQVLPFQAVLATLIAPLAWLSFSTLANERPTVTRLSLLANLLPAILIVVLLLFWRAAIGPTIVLTFLGYGTALLWQARLGPDGLVSSRLDGAVRSYRSLLVTALALIASALTDIVISLDFEWSGGAHSGAVISAANVLALLLLGGAASLASMNVAAEPQSEPVPMLSDTPAATEEDSAISASLDALMQSKGLYRDVELNLGKLARRLQLPARSVSNAINRIHGMSVSQYVNNYRVQEACRLLQNTDDPITRIVFDAGFLTKSNFNREFLRVMKMNPTAWRQSHAPRKAD